MHSRVFPYGVYTSSTVLVGTDEEGLGERRSKPWDYQVKDEDNIESLLPTSIASHNQMSTVVLSSMFKKIRN